MFSLDWMRDYCFLRVLRACCIASVSVGRRGKSGTEDRKTHVGLFKLRYIVSLLVFLSCFKKIYNTTQSAEAW